MATLTQVRVLVRRASTFFDDLDQGDKVRVNIWQGQLTPTPPPLLGTFDFEVDPLAKGADTVLVNSSLNIDLPGSGQEYFTVELEPILGAGSDSGLSTFATLELLSTSFPSANTNTAIRNGPGTAGSSTGYIYIGSLYAIEITVDGVAYQTGDPDKAPLGVWALMRAQFKFGETPNVDYNNRDVWSYAGEFLVPVDDLKATNPSPEDTETKVNWDLTNSIFAPIRDDGYVSWENDADPDSYDIYFGTAPDDLTLLFSEYNNGGDMTAAKWLSPYVDVLVTDTKGNAVIPNGYRPPVAGEVLYNENNPGSVYYVYGVKKGKLVNTHYQYNLYAFRVGEEGSGGFLEDGDVLTNGVQPDPDNPQAVYLVMTERFLAGDPAEVAYFPHNEVTYYWRIDSRFDAGSTEVGDVWSFTTKPLKTAWPGVTLPDDGSPEWNGLPPWTFPEWGIEGVDWAVPNANMIVAASNNAIWYEDKI
jgi:hypothetical protein